MCKTMGKLWSLLGALPALSNVWLVQAFAVNNGQVWWSVFFWKPFE
ncbi:hypothetical protein [Endozoicomonas atrinae]